MVGSTSNAAGGQRSKCSVCILRGAGGYLFLSGWEMAIRRFEQRVFIKLKGEAGGRVTVELRCPGLPSN